MTYFMDSIHTCIHTCIIHTYMHAYSYAYRHRPIYIMQAYQCTRNPLHTGDVRLLATQSPSSEPFIILFSVTLGSRIDRIVDKQQSSTVNCLTSTVLNSVSPVQILIFPNQLAFGLPLARAPCAVPWILYFSKHLSFFFILLCVQ